MRKSRFFAPHRLLTFVPNPTSCTGVQFVFPAGACGCGTRMYSNVCTGGGYTGTPQDGVAGCTLTSSCTIAPSETPCFPLEPVCRDCQRKSGGPPEPPKSEGRPVSVTTGEMYFTHYDATVGTLGFTRSYSTARLAHATRYSAFGRGWNSSFDKRLVIMSATVIEHRDQSGNPTYFQDENADGTFEQNVPFGKDAWIQSLGAAGYNVVFRQGGLESYTTAGVLVSEEDASGVVTTYTRDGSGRLTTITRQGRSLGLTYTSTDPRPTTLESPAAPPGEKTLATFVYEPGATGRLIAVNYPDNAAGYRYVYDSAHRITFVDHADGRPSEAHEYDAQGRATTSEIGDGHEKFTFAYTSSTQTTVTDALGRQTIYDFIMVNHVKEVTKITGTCSSCGGAGDSQEWTYNPNGTIATRKDAVGNTWAYTYDPVTLDVLTETDALGQVTTYTYDGQGRMLTRTGPDGAVTTYAQSAPGPTSITQLVTASPLVARTTAVQYFNTADARKGKVETITDPRGKVTTMAYDTTTGDLTSVTDPLGHATTFAYDETPSPAGRGLRTSVTDALGHVTKTVYDVRGRVKKVINHDNTFTEFGYDPAGRRSTVTDPMGRVTRYVYDRYGRLEAVVDPMNQATRYSYDLMGNLLALTDAKQQTTSFEYDSHNRVKKTTYPGGAFETFTYDSRGRLSTMVDRKNITTTYTYDNLGRLTGKSFTNDPTNTPAFSYTYDVAGRMLTAQNGTDTLTWTYNLAGELLSEQSVKNSSTVVYTYDNGGNRLTVSLDGNLFVTYGYDDASRLTTITRGANVFGFGYDNANRRTTMTYPNGVTTAYVYDELNRLTNLAATHVPTSTPITNFGYQYDAAGNRTQKSTLDYTEDYGYDPLYRLTRADRTNPGATPPNQWTWNYDAVGNRTSAQKDQEATTSTHNEKNQLLQTSGGGKMLWRGVLDEPGTAAFNAASASINGQPARMLAGNVFEATLDLPAGANTVTIQAQDGSGNVASKSYSVNVLGVPATYTYDANGNLATKTEGTDAWVYEWNALKQLTAVTKNAATVATYSYDPLGRRLNKTTPTPTASVIAWLYDGVDIVRETRTGVGAITRRFVHGLGSDEPLLFEDATASALAYLHADGLGSIVRHTNGSGASAETITYDAWGDLQGGTPAPYGFTGRESDPEVSLQYYRSRYYDPSAGRFISEDPIGFEGDVNFYGYVAGNPVNFVDPYGLQKKKSSKEQEEPLTDYEKRKGWPEGSTYGGCIALTIQASCTPGRGGHPKDWPDVQCGFKSFQEAIGSKCANGRTPFVFSYSDRPPYPHGEEPGPTFDYTHYDRSTGNFVHASQGGPYGKAKWGPKQPEVLYGWTETWCRQCTDTCRR